MRKFNRNYQQLRALPAGFLFGTLFFLFANHFLSPPDCASYWAWGEALVRKFSFDFQDSYADRAMPTMYVYLTATERISNDWPMGTGLLLAPFTVLPLAFGHAWIVFVALAAGLYWWRNANASSAGRAWGTGAMVVGTPLLFYTLYGPFFSHVASFAATTAFFVYWDSTRAARTARQWFMLGLLLGISGVVRPQNLFLSVVLLAEIKRLRLLTLTLFAAGALLGFVPQMTAYWCLYGSPLALPKIEEMQWLRPALLSTLFSDFHGVIPWTPLYMLLPAGIVALWRRDRQLAAGLSAAIAVQLYLNAANFVWWGGGSFGNRRLADSAIVIAYAIAALIAESDGRQRRLVYGVIAACCAWTFLLLLAERRGLLPLDRYVSFRTPAFWNNLQRLVLEPSETVAAMLRPLKESNVLLRLLASLLLAGGTMVAVLKPLQFKRRSWLVAPAAMAIVAIICIFAAARTPRITDVSLRSQLSRSSKMLWDNYIELAFYRIERKQYDAAVAAADKAIKLRPDHYSGWWYKGMALYRAEEWMPASEAFAKVKQLNPAHARAAQLQESAIQQSLENSLL